MTPLLALAYFGVGTLGLIVILAFLFLAVVILRPEKPTEPCPRCGHIPGTDPGKFRKPS